MMHDQNNIKLLLSVMVFRFPYLPSVGNLWFLSQITCSLTKRCYSGVGVLQIILYTFFKNKIFFFLVGEINALLTFNTLICVYLFAR
jgi:hypothetical protein